MVDERSDNLFLLDTNVLVYAFDKYDIRKHKVASKLLLSYLNNGNKFALSTQNLSEFFYIVTRKIKHPMKKSEAKDTIKELIKLKNSFILEVKPTTIISGCEICDAYNSHFWDSLLLATMKENGIFGIYTEDVEHFKVPWIKVVNPF